MDLVLAGEAMRAAMDVFEPVPLARHEVPSSPGVVVIGTVEGDIHEFGRNVVGRMPEAAGFTVHDLGLDVPPATFASKA